jgi:ubiquinone/menaquinone biosynthesis C-methylase UbiE
MITATSTRTRRRGDTNKMSTDRARGRQVPPSLDRERRHRYSQPVADTRLAPIIEDLVRKVTVSGPPPRGQPYLGLESASGTGTHLLDALGAHGIFRKYELVLDVAGGLGATGRWLAGRLGCTAVVTAADAAEAAAGRALTRHTRQRAQVQHVAADPAALPFRDARFTHAWIVETLPRVPDADAVIADVFRVIRPGGFIALQDVTRRDGANPPELPGWHFATGAVRRDALARTGFADVVIRPVDDAREHSARVSAARVRLHQELAASGERPLAALAAERAALAGALADGRLQVMQLFARRP